MIKQYKARSVYYYAYNINILCFMPLTVNDYMPLAPFDVRFL